MASRKSRTRKCSVEHLSDKIQGLPYSLADLKGNVIEEGFLGAPRRKGRGVTVKRQDGSKILGVNDSTARVVQVGSILETTTTCGWKLTVQGTGRRSW